MAVYIGRARALVEPVAALAQRQRRGPDAGERRPELVGDGADEVGAHAVGRGHLRLQAVLTLRQLGPGLLCGAAQPLGDTARLLRRALRLLGDPAGRALGGAPAARRRG